MNRDANTFRVMLNLTNFADPFFNTSRADRPEMQAALDGLIRDRQVKRDGFGGWKLSKVGETLYSEIHKVQSV
jgi:hypothetical protein